MFPLAFIPHPLRASKCYSHHQQAVFAVKKTWWLKVLDIQVWGLVSQCSVCPELGWNGLFDLVSFFVFELYLS